MNATKTREPLAAMLHRSAATVFILYGASLLSYQIIFWFFTGDWVSCSMFDSIVNLNTEGPAAWIYHFNSDGHLTKLSMWLLSPDSWIGLHSIVRPLLKHLPISLIAVFIGFAINADANEIALKTARTNEVTKPTEDSNN